MIREENVQSALRSVEATVVVDKVVQQSAVADDLKKKGDILGAASMWIEAFETAKAAGLNALAEAQMQVFLEGCLPSSSSSSSSSPQPTPSSPRSSKALSDALRRFIHFHSSDLGRGDERIASELAVVSPVHLLPSLVSVLRAEGAVEIADCLVRFFPDILSLGPHTAIGYSREETYEDFRQRLKKEAVLQEPPALKGYVYVTIQRAHFIGSSLIGIQKYCLAPSPASLCQPCIGGGGRAPWTFPNFYVCATLGSAFAQPTQRTASTRFGNPNPSTGMVGEVAFGYDEEDGQGDETMAIFGEKFRFELEYETEKTCLAIALYREGTLQDDNFGQTYQTLGDIMREPLKNRWVPLKDEDRRVVAEVLISCWFERQ